jgi:hypothetical protein
MVRRGARVAASALILLGLCAAARLSAQTPDGAAWRVNTVTATLQIGPLVAMDRAGRAVILWTDKHVDAQRLIHPRIAAQRYDPQGRPVAGELTCNEAPELVNSATGVVIDAGGEFVALWGEEGGFRHYARRFLRDAQPAGEPTLIDDSGSQLGRFDYAVGFGGGAGGEFVGVWQRAISVGGESLDGGSFARWFDRDAAPLTAEIPLVGAFRDGGRPLVDVVAGPDRSVLVGWTTEGGDPDRYFDLHVQAYSSAGDKLGPELLVPHDLQFPAAGMAWNPLLGTFVVAWPDVAQDPDGSFRERILLQRLSPLGQPILPQPLIVSEAGGFPSPVACNAKGYCAVSWFREGAGIMMRIVRPDDSVLPRDVSVAAVPAWPGSVAFGGNGALVVGWTNDYEPDDPEDIAARRLIASPADEPCQRIGNQVACDAGRSGALPELHLLDFGLTAHDQLLFGDVDGDGRADPCRARNGSWRCDTDHEGGVDVLLSFAGPASAIPLLGDVDGDGRAEACSWTPGDRTLRCDTAHDRRAPELSVTYGRAGTPLLGDLDGDGRDDLCLASRGIVRCDVAHDGGRTFTIADLGVTAARVVLGDFDGNGTDDLCAVRDGMLECDTAHDGGEAEGRLVLGSPDAPTYLTDLDGV